MCGIVGIGRFTKTAIMGSEREAFQNMLVADTARGVHGTGIFRVDEKGKASWAKSYGIPYDLYRTPGFEENFWDKIVQEWTRWLVGHNRWATTGKKDAKSAHPFEVGDIILVHNGTVRSSKTPEYRQYDVDSEAVCASINNYGLEKTLSQFKMAFALAFYNKKKKTMNLIRNHERPMWLGTDIKEKRIVFASEEKMIAWACERNKIELNTLIEIPTNTLYTFKLDDMNPTITKLEEEEEVKVSDASRDEKGRKFFISNGDKWVLDPKTGIYDKEGPNQIKDSPLTMEIAALLSYKNEKKKSYFPPITTIPQEPKFQKKEDEKKKEYYPTEKYNSLKIGDQAFFTFKDFDKLGMLEKSPLYLVKGTNPKFNWVEFRSRVKETDALDLLMECGEVEGKVVSILVPTDATKDVIIYCTFPAPHWPVRKQETVEESYTRLARDAVPEPLDDASIPEQAFLRRADGE